MLRRKTSSSSFGFTLVEILVVLVILAIAAAIIVANTTGTEDVRASSAAKMIAMDLEYAQSMAITHQDPVTVTFDPDAESYSLTNASGALTHPTSKSEYATDFTTLDGLENVDIVSASFGGGQAVVFDELGTPDNGGSVTVQVGAHAYQISVSAATGKVTVNRLGS